MKTFFAFYGTEHLIMVIRPATGPPPDWFNWETHVNPAYILISYVFKVHFNIILPTLPGSQIVFTLHPSLLLYAVLISPKLATCPTHSLFLTWSFYYYLVTDTNYEVPTYSVFSRLPLFPPSHVQILSSVPWSQTSGLRNKCCLY
jgi:hypothetical protein